MIAPIIFGRLHVEAVVNQFLAHFPEIRVYLTLSDHTINVVNVVDEHIDLAVRVGAQHDRTFVATQVGEIRRVVCGGLDYFAAHGAPQRLTAWPITCA